MMRDDSNDQSVIAETRAWIERAVIGLELCPFTRSVYVSDRIRYRVSDAQSVDALLIDLKDELRALQAADPQIVETTLLIHPRVLANFEAYNQFLDQAEAAVAQLSSKASCRSRASTRTINLPTPM